MCILPVTASEASRFGIVKVNDYGQITFFQEKPAENQLQGLETALGEDHSSRKFPNGRGYLASMGIYVFGKRFLIDLLKSSNENDFAKIFAETTLQHRMMGYQFSGYWADIGTVRPFIRRIWISPQTCPSSTFTISRTRFIPGLVACRPPGSTTARWTIASLPTDVFSTAPRSIIQLLVAALALRKVRRSAIPT